MEAVELTLSVQLAAAVSRVAEAAAGLRVQIKTVLAVAVVLILQIMLRT